jgi:PAS domain S-box-containing protein
MSNLATFSAADQDGYGQVSSVPPASILLVDHQQARLLSYEAALSQLEVRCVRALSGTEALARLLEQEFAVILLNVSMPGMDGFEVARLIRSHPPLERPPIVFVSGAHVSDLDQRKSYEVGGIDYISVPVVPDILRSKVAILVELYQRRRETQALNRELQEARSRLHFEPGQMGQQEARLRAAFEHPALITGVLEAQRDDSGAIRDWIVRDANANAIRIFGQTRDTVIGHAYSEIHPNPDEARRVAAVYAKVLSTGEMAEHETHVNGRDYLVTTFAMNRDTVIASAVDVTQRRIAEQRLSAVLHSINDHLICLDRQWRFTYLNDTTVQFLGRPPHELLGACIWDLFPDAASDYYRDLHTAVREQRIITAEHYYKPWDKWFQNHIYPSGEGVTVFSADITERKQAELALRESEERLALARGAARFGIHDRDLRTGALKWDEFTCQLWGVRPDSRVTFEDFLSAVHPDDRERTQRAIDRALDPEGSGNYCETYRVVNHLDGITRWVEATGHVAFDNGRAVRLVGTVRDVTERAFADERLRASEERFRELANNIDQFVWTCDRLGYATWYNDRWYQYTGTTFAAMKDEGWTRVVHPAHVERVMSRVPQCIQEGRVWEDTFPIRGKDGQYRWFLSRAIPIRDVNGQIIRWFGSNTDVTELRDLQEALKEADLRKDELLARTRKLAENLATVRESERRAAALRLHEGVAQELYAAQLSVQQLERRGRGRSGIMEIANELSRIIDQSLDHVRNLTDDLYPTSLVHLSLSKALEQLGYQFAKRSGVKVVVDQLPDFPELDAESRVLFFRAAQEALANVARHAEASTVSITLEADTERTAMLVVDDGKGIAADDLQKAGSLGLIGIRERFVAAGGGATIERGAACGTCLTVFLPTSPTP